MKTKLILATLVVISAFSFLSCNKVPLNQPDAVATQPTSNNGISISRNAAGQLMQKGAIVLYQATSTNISAFETAFHSSVLGGITGRPPACGVLVDQASMLTQIRSVAGDICNGDATLELTYLWLVFEGPLAIDPSPSTFTFTVTDQATPTPKTYNGTYVNPPTQTTLTCNPIINACGHVFAYEITINVDQPDFVATTSTINTVYGTGPGGCGTTTSVSHSVGTTDCGFYLNNPARIYPLTQPSQPGVVLIFTDCSVGGCFDLLFQCPSSGVFEYRLHNTTGWPNAPVSLGPNGGFASGLTTGQLYDYQCTLNYSSCGGSSQVKTGTFTP